jgi:hypothetical protein
LDPAQGVFKAVVEDDAVEHVADELEVDLAGSAATLPIGALPRLETVASEHAIVVPALGAGVEIDDCRHDRSDQCVGFHRGLIWPASDRVRNGSELGTRPVTV